jgi:hypothetical protein
VKRLRFRESDVAIQHANQNPIRLTTELSVNVERWVIPRSREIACIPKRDQRGFIALGELSNLDGVGH